MPVKAAEDEGELPSGDTIAANLARLGLADRVVRHAEIARRIEQNTGKKISRQRISNIIGSLRVRPTAVAMLAEGLRIKPEELTRRPKEAKS